MSASTIMSFISFDFLLFAPFVVWLYQVVPTGYRGLVLLGASYLFYAWWDFYYIGLILLSSTVAYICGIQLQQTRDTGARRLWLLLGIVVILGQLFFFKYFGFFLSNLNSLVGTRFELLGIILPIGISFFSRQTTGYIIDVYRGKFPAERNLRAFFLYVCFYPQLVAGPIERAARLIPQLREFDPITRENFRAGIVHIAWGLMLKLIVGDRLAVAAADVFARPESYSSIDIFISMFFQWIHVFCDFYGYSEMARGLALIFGIRLMRNFDNPFLAINTRAFWQRWHISLTKWVFDYLYFPLVGRRSTQFRRSVCLVITMLIIGLWHGASWNFVLFGLYHAVVMLIQDLFHKYGLFRLPKYLAALVNMIIIGPSTILFMTPDLPQALRVVEHMVFSELPLTIQLLSGWGVRTAIVFFVLILIIETRYRGVEIAAEKISGLSTPVRWILYLASIVILLTFGMLRENDFVYFQF